MVIITKIMLSLLSILGCEISDTNTGTLISVIDGDTIDVNVNGQTQRVRLIGIDAPETKHPTKQVGCYGMEANRYVNTLLPKGTKVILRLDKEATDKYGRTLAYVYLKSNNLFINLQLITKGYAKTMKFKPNTLHAYEFEKAQTKAKTNQVGLWDKCK